jgi:hypothetical protein
MKDLFDSFEWVMLISSGLSFSIILFYLSLTQ